MLKLLFALVVVLAAGNAAFIPDDSLILVGNVIDNLIKEALEYLRKLLKDHEPLLIPDIPPQHIVDKDVDLNVVLSQVKVSKASDFTVEHIENNLPKLLAKFEVKIPSVHLEGDYEVTGVVLNKKVTGKGNFVVVVDHLDQKGEFQLEVLNHGIHMKELSLEYDLKGLKSELQGLSIEGMTKEQVEDLLNKQFFDFLQTHKKDVTEAVARQVMEKANEIVDGKTLKELLDWLKKQIHPDN